MRIITVPPSVVMGEKVATFGDLLSLALVDARFGKNAAAIRLCKEVVDAANAGKPEVAISDDAWRLLVCVTEEPREPYDPRVFVHLVSFLDAVRDAIELPDPNESQNTIPTV